MSSRGGREQPGDSTRQPSQASLPADALSAWGCLLAYRETRLRQSSAAGRTAFGQLSERVAAGGGGRRRRALAISCRSQHGGGNACCTGEHAVFRLTGNSGGGPSGCCVCTIFPSSSRATGCGRPAPPRPPLPPLPPRPPRPDMPCRRHPAHCRLPNPSQVAWAELGHPHSRTTRCADNLEVCGNSIRAVFCLHCQAGAAGAPPGGRRVPHVAAPYFFSISEGLFRRHNF